MERPGTHTPPGPWYPDLAHLAPLLQMERKLLQQVKVLKWGRAGHGLSSPHPAQVPWELVAGCTAG